MKNFEDMSKEDLVELFGTIYYVPKKYKFLQEAIKVGYVTVYIYSETWGKRKYICMGDSDAYVENCIKKRHDDIQTFRIEIPPFTEINEELLSEIGISGTVTIGKFLWLKEYILGNTTETYVEYNSIDNKTQSEYRAKVHNLEISNEELRKQNAELHKDNKQLTKDLKQITSYINQYIRLMEEISNQANKLIQFKQEFKTLITESEVSDESEQKGI